MSLSNRDLYVFLQRWARDNYTGAAPIEILLRMSDGGRVRLSVPRVQEPAPSDHPADAIRERRHTPDFCSVLWKGTLYVLSPTQAAIVKALWEAWEAGTNCVHGQTLLELADCESNKMSDVFKNSPAWGALIVEGPVKGTYRLAD